MGTSTSLIILDYVMLWVGAGVLVLCANADLPVARVFAILGILTFAAAFVTLPWIVVVAGRLIKDLLDENAQLQRTIDKFGTEDEGGAAIKTAN